MGFKLVNVSRETFIDQFNVNLEKIDKLLLFEKLLIETLSTHQIISRKDEKKIWNRHILDSLMMMFHVKHYNIDVIDDVGSGGGFPGLVLAVVIDELKVRLVERKIKKCNFLAQVIKKLGLKNVDIICRDSFEKKIFSDFLVTRAVFGEKASGNIYKLISDKGIFFNYQNELYPISKLKIINKLDYVLPGEEKKRYLVAYRKSLL
ncbi:16S rRNA (guanine(527)-N(7))-methyltransferase RsmG [candidate division WOR-3 bacterium]|nr:16S rRNA (guanine(527)-N(7))-methyltransferase RsmG [candidate division WOR-3 bacterium]